MRPKWRRPRSERRTRVRSFRPGQNAQAWSQLLDDIQAAKECLCDSAQKAEYDDRLRGQQATQFVHSAIEPAIDSATAPASVLAPLQSELYPPGMARPVGSRKAALASVQVQAAAAAPRPKSDLDPPVRGRATTAQAESATRTAEAVPAYMLPTPAMPQPIAATPTYYQSETATTANSWVAGPSPIYDATAAGGYADLPLALPVSAAPYAAGVDPMAPVSVAGLLPPGAAEGDAVASAQPIPEAAISTAPSSRTALQPARSAGAVGLGSWSLFAASRWLPRSA